MTARHHEQHYVDPTDSWKTQRRILIKIVVVIVMILTPLFVLMLGLTPFARSKTEKRISNPYQLPSFYNRDDLVGIVAAMSKDPVFALYFRTLTPTNISDAIRETYEFLDKNRGKDLLRSEIERKQRKVEALSVAFMQEDYPAEFSRSPLEHERQAHILWTFFYEEFKVTLLGLCYKATYEPAFNFRWQDQSMVTAAATKLRQVLGSLPDGKRKALGESFRVP